jgi:tetratricopeptide (TPR) repeat protein
MAVAGSRWRDYYARTGRGDQAKKVLDAIVAGDPKFAALAKVRLARLKMSERDKEGARALLNEVLKERPGHVEALVANAGLLTEERRFDDAQAALTAALASNPRSVDANFALGALHALRGRSADALKAFNEVLKVNPEHAAAQFEVRQTLPERRPTE